MFASRKIPSIIELRQIRQTDKRTNHLILCTIVNYRMMHVQMDVMYGHTGQTYGLIQIMYCNKKICDQIFLATLITIYPTYAICRICGIGLTLDIDMGYRKCLLVHK